MAYLKDLEKLKILESESDVLHWKIETLEKITKREFNLQDFMKSKDIDLMKLFNEIIVRNLDKTDQLKTKNKIMLENLINLGRECKQLRGTLKK